MAKQANKPYRVITYYGGYDALQDKLDALGVVYTCCDVFSGFWGKEYKIYKPRGKGATAKCKAIDAIM